MGKLISKRYAVALFELAKENEKVDEFYTQIESVLNSLNENKEFLNVLNHPRVSTSEKFTLFQNVFKENVSEEILGLVSIVINKNREAELENIFKTFLELVKDFKGITTAFVYSATKLTKSQLDSIEEKLSKKLNKDIIIEVKQQPDLIGGMLINVDGKVIDNTIKKQLLDIRKSLINN